MICWYLNLPSVDRSGGQYSIRTDVKRTVMPLRHLHFHTKSQLPLIFGKLLCAVIVPTQVGIMSLLLFSSQHAIAYEIANLLFPQNIIADDGQVYYIANANGDPGTRENNGFISKADQEGKITDRHFIKGGQKSVTLHSPKEMAIIGSTLYVADLDVVRGFEKTTGDPIVTILLTRFRAESLTGLTADSQGKLYVSDADTNTIFQIDPAKNHAISELIHDVKLSHPHGLAIHPRNGHLMGVGWDDGKFLKLMNRAFFTNCS